MTNFAFRPRPAHGFIETDERLRLLQTHVREIMRLQRIWQGIVPAGLAEASRIGQINAEAISIYADHGAAAAKLRQLIPSIAAALAKHEIIRPSILVKVRTQAIPDRYHPVSKREISQAALSQLGNLHRQLEEGTLKTALATLLNRHR
ncbi:MAG: DciA family protein [Sulfuriferula sp.]